MPNNSDGSIVDVYYDDGSSDISDYLTFHFEDIDGFESIPIGSELAKLEIYENRECTGTPL